MSASSSAPAPEPAGAAPATPPPNTPRPSVVPPQTPGPSRTKWWGIALAVLVVAGGIAFYLKSQSQVQSTGGGPVVTVPTTTVALADLQTTVRVSGTVRAENFASLLAPRIMGSRSGFQRGGTDSNFGGGGGGGGGGGMGGDFNLILLSLAKAGTHVKTGDIVGQFDPQFQQQRYDDYKDSVVQLENSIKKLIANLAATREAHDQTVRAAKSDWDKAVLDLQTAPIRSQIDAEKYKL